MSCFAIGTYAELSALNKVFQGHFTHTNSTLLIGKVVGGIDYYHWYRPADFWVAFMSW